MRTNQDFVVIISADAEWQVVKGLFPESKCATTPYGEWIAVFYRSSSILEKPVIFFHGGWGKVSAAGSAQYAIDRWHPRMIVNLGTCGGFEGEVKRGEIILVKKTVIYDIYEQMGDPDEHIQYYTAELDTAWVSDPLPVTAIRKVLVSGDRDLYWKDVSHLKNKYGAIAGDWESGAIAWVALRNHTLCFILRGVTDLVGEKGGEAYNGNVQFYYRSTVEIMTKLVMTLPQWLEMYYRHSIREPSE
jgi:adenosylhomocysteine nucleosidase